ncbi:integrase core domain protein [Ancylostoma caninum]|uniref:Integrase core domain protein n=1 Tax=Ancylostoma caninum TaxID=29170 RepID=A0A368GCX9_ANCCA|nr:integrase core domain protein [Ancylostoma caninum]
MLSKEFFWETMRKDVLQWADECKNCILHNQKSEMTPPLKPILTTKPYEMIGIDILEMGLTSSGNRYILSVIDHFTKYGGAYPVDSKSAETVARVLFEKWMAEGCRFPRCILSDQGGEFDNKLLSELSKILGIRQVFTKGYNPRENGLTERFNKTVIQLLRKKVEIHCARKWKYPWRESPFFLLHGFDAYIPRNSMSDTRISTYMVDLDSYINEMLVGMKLAHEHAQECNENARQKMKATYDKGNRVIERPLTLGDRVYMRVPAEKASSKHPKLVNEWTGPFRVTDLSDNSALVTLINANEDPKRVPFDQLRKLPRGVDDEPVQTTKSRTRRGRPKKNKIAKISCFRVEIGDPRMDPLHLLYACTCGIFNEKAQVALPGLRNNLARTKKVKNLFELANVASTALEPAWGKWRKENELTKKQSTHLTVIGLSCAISAHRSFCHDFAVAAMARREYLTQFDDDDMPTNSIILALPQSFAKVETEGEREPSVKFVVYNHLDDMADQLNKIAISASIRWVWPNRMPRSDQMRRCMQAIERHLQCGGTLDCFPAPFEKCSKDEWDDLRRVCIGAVRMLTGPARGFDARVMDHYGSLVDSVPILHPALSLGISPRKGGDRFQRWQVLVFLEQLREAASNTLRLPKFKLKPRKKPENLASSQGRKRARNEPEKKKRKIPKRPELMYLRDPKKKKEEQAPNMKQRGRGPY